MTELSTRYNPKDAEEKWLAHWKEHNTFHAKPNTEKKPFCMVIPPPNVTGILHMGHALNNTLQDILIRYRRMQGYETLWMPGTDHAGIATQNVVEKQLAKEGKKRQDLGREEFIKRLWQWKQEYGETIIRQLEKLGSSCDWQRTRFTMDDKYSDAVKEVFVRLYEKGLIYRGEYIINWCPRCQTALADEEAEHQETHGTLTHIRYPLKDTPDQYVTVATTRPETMLGDTAVAVNPKDNRYKKLIGKTVVLPLMNRGIPIIADAFVDPEFGTGAVKVTPAHDPNDFEMGQRHNLPSLNIMRPDGRLNDNVGQYANMDRFVARKAVIKDLQEQHLIEKIDAHVHAVGHCYRCHTMVEPYLSRQWFVKMKPLARPAVDVVRKGKVRFHPDRWTKVYLNWMENIRDWCISRQIWWGHRIPVWYCPQCPANNNIIVAKETPQKCPRCNATNLKQEEDVLDTWFSSWLWPFATLGWPEENTDLKYFYPTNTLFTASEIIFFWVARMIMGGLEFMNDIPFSDVYIHGTVRDAKGVKMSKSLGNAIDPLEIIDEYGADALRFSLIVNSGQDLFISKEKFEIGRNFANKIWNATRLILMNVDSASLTNPLPKTTELDLPSRWILSRLHATIRDIEKALEQYRFSEAETLIYDFFWKTFCDWYLEIIKESFSDARTGKVVLYILAESLKLLHPFMPFVTEEIWQQLHKNKDCLSVEPWPIYNKRLVNKAAEKDMATLIELITTIRNVRASWNVDSRTTIDCIVTSRDTSALSLAEDNTGIIRVLAKIGNISVKKDARKPSDSATGIAGKMTFFIPLAGVIDIAREKERMEAELTKQVDLKKNLSQRLKNKEFIRKAPKDVVEKERARLELIESKIAESTKTLSELE